MNLPFRIALYQPDIPGNTGAILRLGACLGVEIDLIEPAGFDLSDRALRRAGMDYLDQAALVRHADFAAFRKSARGNGARLVAFTTKATMAYTEIDYVTGDILLFGRESAGLPDAVCAAADLRVTIPMPGSGRSLNLAMAAAMAAGEAMRQLLARAAIAGPPT